MVPFGLVIIPIFFAKEVLSSDVDHNNDKTRHLDDDESSSTPEVSLASSSISSCSSNLDDLSIDESYLDAASLVTLCSLLGPPVVKDEDSTSVAQYSLPSNLQDSIVIDLPVGFYRLRRSFLSNRSTFWTESILKGALNYDEVSATHWEHPHNDFIGEPNPPKHVINSDYVGAKKETTYLMPAGRLIGANKAHETSIISAYESDYFALSISTSTPGVPFGSRFLARTQIVVINTGENTCQLICSVEAEFPKGPPLGMKGQIQKGMKKGTIEMFEKIGSHIKNCAVSYGWC